MPDQPCRDDSCEIVALLGRELLGWGKAPPDISQFPIFYRPDGVWTLVEQRQGPVT